MVVLSADWGPPPGGERGTALRAVAGALTRLADVDVLVPGPAGARGADGAFEPLAVGEPARGRRWPAPGRADRVLAGPPGRADRAGEGGHARVRAKDLRAVVVDAADAEGLELAVAVLPGVPIAGVGSAADPGAPPSGGAMTLLQVDLRAGAATHQVGTYVRVHPDAARRPHQSLGGISPYVLVLGDRPGRAPGASGAEPPSERVRWLLARFARRYVVVVEQATATVWRSRARITSFRVHTRMDLWRLLAHARSTVDLAPGTLFARECVESLRYGVPFVAAAGSPADAFAASGHGLCFDGTTALLECVEALDDPAVHEQCAASGRELADRWYGDAVAFVDRIGEAIGATTSGGRSVADVRAGAEGEGGSGRVQSR